jgi:putative NADH-flavin reductase
MADEAKKRIAVLGASGGIGRRIVRRALGQGYALTCQTRTAGKLADVAGSVEIHAFAPTDAAALGTFVKGADAVIFALGVDAPGATTLFSDATQALAAAMQKAGVKRLIAVTGVGAGETRGHGGFFYDRIIFPLFTRQRYADKDRQEALIAASELDWIIVRPAPFAEAAATGPLQVHTRIAPETVLRRITRDEVAAFVVAQIGDDRYLRQRPFIGHP